MCCQAVHLFVGERVPAMLAACNPDATVSEKKKKSELAIIREGLPTVLRVPESSLVVFVH